MNTPEEPKEGTLDSRETRRNERIERFNERLEDEASEALAFAKEHPGEEFPADKLREFRIHERMPDPESTWKILVDEKRQEIRIVLLKSDRSIQDIFVFRLPENKNQTL